MSSIPENFSNVAVATKANIYFDGGVISHAVQLPDGSRKTLGLIRPGSYHFGTDAPERMELVAGDCRVTLDGRQTAQNFTTGESFDVPGKSGFTIVVERGVCEYICSFLI